MNQWGGSPLQYGNVVYRTNDREKLEYFSCLSNNDEYAINSEREYLKGRKIIKIKDQNYYIQRKSEEMQENVGNLEEN